MTTTPEERRDARIQALVNAGLVVTGHTPLATADDPHTVAAYRLHILEPTNRSRSRLEAQEAATALEETTDLIEWTPAPEPEIAPEPAPEVEPDPDTEE